MPKQITAWGCEWCGMTSRYKANVVRHEKNFCPRNKACQVCAKYTEVYETVYDRHHGGDPGSTDYEVLVLCCGDDVIEERKCNCPDFQTEKDVEDAADDRAYNEYISGISTSFRRGPPV